MVMASLFLMWGREAWHLTNLFVEPVYFVSGLNFPVGGPRPTRGARPRHDPAGDRSRRDAPAGVRGPADLRPAAIPAPVTEAALLAVMTVVFTLIARVSLRTLETRARREGRLTMRWR